MAQLTLFHYLPAATPVHRVDARFKLPLFLVIVAAVLHSAPGGLAVLSASLVLLIALSRLPVARALRELMPFLLLLLLMFLVRSLGGTADRSGVAFSASSLAAGALLVWQLLLLLFFGTLLAATQSTAHLQAAIAWYLRPFPFIPGNRIATMVGLTISLIPLIFDSYRDISDAQHARCIDASRGPTRRLRTLLLPLLLTTFGRADALGAAMESRCYSEERSFAPLRSSRGDWAAAAIVLAVAALALAIGRIAL